MRKKVECQYCGANVINMKLHYTSLKCTFYRDYLDKKPLNEYQMVVLMDARLIHCL